MNKKLFYILLSLSIILVGCGGTNTQKTNFIGASETLSNKSLCASYTKDYDKEVSKEDKHCHGQVFYSAYYDSCIAEKYCIEETDKKMVYEYLMKNHFDDRLIFTCYQTLFLGGQAEDIIGTTVFDHDLEQKMVDETSYKRNETRCTEVDGIVFDYIK